MATNEIRKTQSTVALNAKLTSVNLQAIEYDGSFTVEEGEPICISPSTGKAAVPGGNNNPATLPTTSPIVYMNFVDSDRSDIQFTQTDPTDSTAPTRSISGGGLTGILGTGIEIGLPAASWAGGALPSAGNGVFVNAANKFAAEASPTAGDYFYGFVTRVTGGYAFFTFTSHPIKY